MDAVTLRRTWNEFFAERQHTLVPSASLIPTHPTAPMFTNSGMMQFVPYFLGEEPVPFDPAGVVDPEVRAPGRQAQRHRRDRPHRRHLTFFEMLGNWSFGEYYQLEAIKWAWELVLSAGFDGDRIWPTVHISDDDGRGDLARGDRDPDGADPAPRQGQLLGDGRDRPVRPVLGDPLRLRPEWGDEGGPAHGGGDRYIEFWNLVFMRTSATPTARSPAARPERRHRRRLRALAHAPRRTPARVIDTDILRRSSTPRSRSPVAPTASDPTTTTPCASSPTTPAR